MTSRAEITSDIRNFQLDATLVRIVMVVCGACYVSLSYIAWGWPSIDGYPTIERYLDPAFLLQDFYTNTSASYGVDTLLAAFFGFFEQISGIRYEITLAVLNLLRCLIFPWLVYRLFLALSEDRAVAFAGAVLGTFANFDLPRTLGWPWVWGDASTAMFAVCAIMFGWCFLIRRIAWPCMLLFAVATLLHPLTALLGSIFIALVFFLDYSDEERKAAVRAPVNIVSAGIYAATFLTQYVLLSASSAERLTTAAYVNIVAYERHPGDYLLSLAEPSRAFAFGLASLAVVLLLWRLWGNLPRRRLIAGTLATYFGLGVLGYLFVEIWPIRFFVQLMPLRLALMGAPIMLLVVAHFAGRELREQRYFTFAVVLGSCILASPYAGLFAERIHIPFAGQLEAVAAAILLAVVVIGTHIPFRIGGQIHQYFGWLFSDRRLAVTLCLGLLLVTVVAGTARREAFVIPDVSNQHPVYAWASNETPREAVFLVEQNSSGVYGRAINPQKMRLIGRRAVLASLDFPFLDKDMQAWFERWRDVLERGTPDRVENAGPKALLMLHEQYPFDYIVRRSALREHPNFVLEKAFGASHGLENLLVYRVRNPAEPQQP